MKERVLASSRRVMLWWQVGGVGLLLVASIILARQPTRFGAWQATGPALFGVACLYTWYSARGAYLKVGPDGLGVKRNAFSEPLHVRWRDVEAVDVTTGPIGRSVATYAGIRLAPSSKLHSSGCCIRNRKSCGYDLVIAENFGMTVQALVAFLREQQAASVTGEQPIRRTSSGAGT